MKRPALSAGFCLRAGSCVLPILSGGFLAGARFAAHFAGSGACRVFPGTGAGEVDKQSIVGLVLGTALLAGNMARADMITVQSVEAESTDGLGSFTGSIDYQPTGPGMGTLVFSF